MNSPKLKELLLNKWVEYSGGSRPGTNKLRFSDDNDGQHLDISYIFDWNTNEAVNLSFKLDPDDFDYLINHLFADSFASLKKESANEELIFEWKLAEGKIQFRVNGRGLSGFEGYIRYLVDDYRDLLIERFEIV